MIIGIIHKGSGIGDQLFSYIATRVRAADLGVDFGFVGKEFFKGASFMNLDWGKHPDIYEYETEYPSGKTIMKDNVCDIYELNKPYYDPEFNFIPDYSVIDGYGAQDIRYFEHRLGEVREWLKVEPLEVPDNKVICNIRGGEYRSVPELFLPREYWKTAYSNKIFDKVKWLEAEIHTDDLELAKEWFRDVKAIKDIELNWRSVRYAKNAIISNSAFAIIPRLLAHLDNQRAVTIAPKYWAGRNVGEWRRPGNYYKKFTYI